jgi:hypothetical protein
VRAIEGIEAHEEGRGVWDRVLDIRGRDGASSASSSSDVVGGRGRAGVVSVWLPTLPRGLCMHLLVFDDTHVGVARKH